MAVQWHRLQMKTLHTTSFQLNTVSTNKKKRDGSKPLVAENLLIITGQNFYG